MTGFKRALIVALVATANLGAVAATEPESNWDKFKSYSHQQKNDAVALGKKAMAETDKKIDELAKRVKGATGETKAAHEKNMQELQAKKNAAQVELGKLEKAGGEAWEATKTGFSNAVKDLSQSYDKAVAALKK